MWEEELIADLFLGFFYTICCRNRGCVNRGFTSESYLIRGFGPKITDSGYCP